MKETAPRYGAPESTESDGGAHFTANIVDRLYKSLGIERNRWTPPHPQSWGQVERTNTTLKEKTAEVRARAGLKRPKALNCVLRDVPNALRQPAELTPTEGLRGRHLPTPGAASQPRAAHRLGGPTTFYICKKGAKIEGNAPNGADPHRRIYRRAIYSREAKSELKYFPENQNWSPKGRGQTLFYCGLLLLLKFSENGMKMG